MCVLSLVFGQVARSRLFVLLLHAFVSIRISRVYMSKRRLVFEQKIVSADAGGDSIMSLAASQLPG